MILCLGGGVVDFVVVIRVWRSLGFISVVPGAVLLYFQVVDDLKVLVGVEEDAGINQQRYPYCYTFSTFGHNRIQVVVFLKTCPQVGIVDV